MKLAIPVREFLFDESVQLTGITEYGVSWEKFVSGEATLPLEGARFDIAFAGTLEGPKIKGRIEGVDYLLVRADGRPQLNLQASITTDDGEKIAVEEDGILFPDPETGPGTAQLRLNMRLTTASPKYNWVNLLHIWLHGSVDMVKGEVQVTAYAA
jgi:hypothetical protein